MTDILISGVDLPPASIRGATQTLEPINAASQTARTVNGQLHDISAEQFRKYQSVISCLDQQVPALNDVWPGLEVTVECSAVLSYRTGQGAPARPVVESWEDGEFTFYRPRLEMRVISYVIDRDEWQAVIGWSIRLEEI